MSQSTEIYPLGRNKAESSRLDEQHRVLVDLIGGPIDESVPGETLSAVADIATGTGVWLREARKALGESSTRPERYYHGFDISSAQFPAESDGINYSVQDVFKPFPAEQHGRYDLVHVRLLVLALKESEYQAAVKNILSLLKPGGYLQWVEIGFADLYDPASTHPKAAPSLHPYLKFIDDNEISHDMPECLRVEFSKAGLVNVVKREAIVPEREDLKPRTAAWLMGFFNTLLPQVFLRSGEAVTSATAAERTGEALRHLKQYFAEGEMMSFRIGSVVGQKPRDA
ncbi:hypothetical protein BJX61DRAFT_534113 [Aspergillus egyptiacus]|nr:hypothetical protein BJX61DRAFT_534113 [Aspergillus egyptiacus]